MKAHKVKCQICAKGVLMVTYTAIGSNTPATALVSAALTEDEAIDFVARGLAVGLTNAAVESGRNDVVFTMEDAKFGFNWKVEHMQILSHL